MVEPYLGEGVSSPRRRTWVYHCESEEAPGATSPRIIRRWARSARTPRSCRRWSRCSSGTSRSRPRCPRSAASPITSPPIGWARAMARSASASSSTRSAARRPPEPLETMALGLYPNPEVDFELEEDPAAAAPGGGALDRGGDARRAALDVPGRRVQHRGRHPHRRARARARPRLRPARGHLLVRPSAGRQRRRPGASSRRGRAVAAVVSGLYRARALPRSPARAARPLVRGGRGRGRAGRRLAGGR